MSDIELRCKDDPEANRRTAKVGEQRFTRRYEWIDVNQQMPTEEAEFWCYIVPRESYWFNVPGYEHQTKKGEWKPFQAKVPTYFTKNGELRFNCGCDQQVTHYIPYPFPVEPPAAPTEPLAPQSPGGSK